MCLWINWQPLYSPKWLQQRSLEALRLQPLGMIRMMNEEGKREGGHLNINKVILKDVIDLHGMLLQIPHF